MSLSVASWEVPFQITTPVANLDLNTPVVLTSGSIGKFVINPHNSNTLIPIRFDDNDKPQADGGIPGERFYSFYEMTLAIQLQLSNGAPACNEDLQEMADILARIVRGIPRSSSDLVEARVYWTPEGAAQRMIRTCLNEEPIDWNLVEGGYTEATFTVKSEYPYAWDAAEITTALPDTLTNTGTADMWPTIKVYGPASSFVITNPAVVDDEGNPLSIVYVGSLNPGGSSIGVGDYVEIRTFLDTMFLNGDGADMTPGLDVMNSDFFPIAVGPNAITITGATADVLWQNAWG